MNTTIGQVHDAIRNYRSLLTRRNAAKADNPQEKSANKQVKKTDTVDISEDGAEKMRALILNTKGYPIENGAHPDWLLINGENSGPRGK